MKINLVLERRWGLSSGQFGRLAQILALAIAILIYNVMAMAVANSLFVSHVGASNLPLAFILIGLCSMPAYASFSQIVDRYSRPRLFRYLLLGAIAMSWGLRGLLTLNAIPIYYILLIVVFFQWDFHNNILYASLLTDYFTTLEYKRYAPFIGIAQAIGTMLGGGLTVLLSHYFSTKDLLWYLPIFMAIALWQLFYLENSQRPIETNNTDSPVGILESLKTAPDLIKKYPLVLFLALSSFLLVIIYISSEFLWFNIYGQYFSESQLTGFLGLMRMIISAIQVVFLYGVTRPLLKWIGVARLNPVYPLTTLISFVSLLFNLNLPAAIALHINGDALYKSINLPVHQLNYNAIPHQFIGRIRTLSDGLIYSLGLTLAGIVLWICHLYLDLVQITCLGLVLTILLLLVRLPMGGFYARSLEAMIRSDTIDLDDFNEEGTSLPPQSSTVIRELLQDGDRYTQIKGLELAASTGNPGQFLPEVKALLTHDDQRLRQGVVKLYSQHLDPETLRQLVNILMSCQQSILRTTALEILIINQYPFTPEQLESLHRDQTEEIKALAAIATMQQPDVDQAEIVARGEQIWQQPLGETTASAIARVVTYSRNREFIHLIEYMLVRATPDIKRQGLEALISLAIPGNSNLAKIAAAEMNHSEPLVRVAAFKLLGITRCEEMLETVAAGLHDNHPQVRQQVANTLAAYGKSGLNIAKNSLTDSNPTVVDTAIAAIGRIKTKQASDILYKYLTPELQQISLTRKWQQQIPSQDPNWQTLAIAIEDYHQRLLQKVLYILACLGHSRTVNIVNRILVKGDRRDLSNAVEILASLSHRRFILPLIPLLEEAIKSESPTPQIQPTPQWLRSKGYKLLLEALESSDRWIRTGASIALASIPSVLLEDSDPVVRSVAQEIFIPICQLNPTSTSMNRLLLLKNVPLFKNLSLDELFPIDKALEQKQVLAGETIYTEGSWGRHLYIIAQGKVKIVKQLDEEQQEIKQLTAGQYFGEIALFDDAPRWDGAIALEDCILLELEKKRFISLIAQRPHIILEICRFLSQRLRETDKFKKVKN
ncbi:MAG: cyclic nucleotide-binding domain-containing protein [Pleurocapsa sp.]